jgi:hypothetical protein
MVPGFASTIPTIGSATTANTEITIIAVNAKEESFVGNILLNQPIRESTRFPLTYPPLVICFSYTFFIASFFRFHFFSFHILFFRCMIEFIDIYKLFGFLSQSPNIIANEKL